MKPRYPSNGTTNELQDWLRVLFAQVFSDFIDTTIYRCKLIADTLLLLDLEALRKIFSVVEKIDAVAVVLCYISTTRKERWF